MPEQGNSQESFPTGVELGYFLCAFPSVPRVSTQPAFCHCVTVCWYKSMGISSNPTTAQSGWHKLTILENSREDSSSSLWHQCSKEKPHPMEVDNFHSQWITGNERVHLFCVHILSVPLENCVSLSIGKLSPCGRKCFKL